MARPIGRVIQMARACGFELVRTDGGGVKFGELAGDVPAWILVELSERNQEAGEWLRREDESKKVERKVSEVFPGAKVEQRYIVEP